MIQKNLLSCWFGRGKKSELFLQCEETKRKVLPDWERYEINEDTIDPAVLKCQYMQSVLLRGEFVKATELGRLWALWKYGGVYMDEDVEVIKPLDPLLDDKFFIGYEDERYLNGAVIGSRPGGHEISKLYWGFPRDSTGTEKATAYGPLYLSNMLIESKCTKYQPEYFYPIHYDGSGAFTVNSYCNHMWAGSWKGYANG